MTAELLAPAGDEQTARVALLAGADAVYLGLTRFSAREGAENFDASALQRTTRLAHLLGAKVYVALNTLVKDSETDDFFASAVAAWNAGADAILIQDIFLGKVLKGLYPEIELHLSTQGGCCNTYGARLAKDFGFSRVVLARETPLEEIGKIAKIIETEVFVQGALCTAFSGQCYLSSFAGNNSGNRGRCKQPCRKKYSIDRKGFDECAYALSTSDLCVGESIDAFLKMGVRSLKIEGRMRRPEYCAAAVGYYRALLDGKNSAEAFRQLRRTYNRGDYTRGLAFGQEHFLSRNVQGHIGEKIGELSVWGWKYFCKSSYSAGKGDGFKVLREGKEVGGGSFLASGKGGFFLASKERLRTGDEVRLTTDAAGGSALLAPVKFKEIEIEIRLVAGERPFARCGEYILRGDEPLDAAKSAPLTEKEIVSCFEKTDDLPILPRVQAVTLGAFLPKSALNAFRRKFYAGLFDYLAPIRKPLPVRAVPTCTLVPEEGGLTASIGGVADIVIDKPDDYQKLTPRSDKWLYLPPFLTTAEADDVMSRAKGYCGIYCDGYYGISLAKAYGVKLFAGEGMHLTNRYSVRAIADMGASFFVLSKEISAGEQRALAIKGAFSLQRGGIKVMDLIYCPFEKTCASCDRRGRYTLTDEEGRKFPLRRYRVNGACRFELYNCAALDAEVKGVSALVDETAAGEGRTRGHSERSML